MKDQSTSTNGISLIFPGPSIEGLNLSKLDGTTIVTINRCMAKFASDFALISDIKHLQSLMYYFPHKKETSIFYTDGVQQALETTEITCGRTGKKMQEMLEDLKGHTAFPDNVHEDKAVNALDFCCSYLGADAVNIYGLDLCSTKNKTHAYNFGHKIQTGRVYAGGYWVSEDWQRTSDLVESLNKSGRWSNMQITNKSPKTILRCFKEPNG